MLSDAHFHADWRTELVLAGRHCEFVKLGFVELVDHTPPQCAGMTWSPRRRCDCRARSRFGARTPRLLIASYTKTNTPYSMATVRLHPTVRTVRILHTNKGMTAQSRRTAGDSTGMVVCRLSLDERHNQNDHIAT